MDNQILNLLQTMNTLRKNLKEQIEDVDRRIKELANELGRQQTPNYGSYDPNLKDEQLFGKIKVDPSVLRIDKGIQISHFLYTLRISTTEGVKYETFTEETEDGFISKKSIEEMLDSYYMWTDTKYKDYSIIFLKQITGEEYETFNKEREY